MQQTPNPTQKSSAISPHMLLVVLVFLLCMTNAQFWLSWFLDTASALVTQTTEFASANRDFANYWLSGKLVRSGEYLDLFVQATHQDQLHAAFGMEAMETRAWSYPPHFLLITSALGFFSYPAAYLVFMVLSLTLLVFAVFKLVAQFKVDPGLIMALVLLPYVILQISAGQNGFFFAALMVLALIYREENAIVTGLALGLLTMKPQLGVLFPLLLLFERNYRAIIWAGFFTLLFGAVSIGFFGVESWRLFFTEVAAYQQTIARESTGPFLRMMPSWYASFRATGIEASLALIIHFVVALPVFVITVLGFYKSRNLKNKSALLVASTFVLLPYVFNYDLGALLVFTAIVFLPDLDATISKDRMGMVTLIVLAALFALALATPISIFPYETELSAAKYLLLLPPMIVTAIFCMIAAKTLSK